MPDWTSGHLNTKTCSFDWMNSRVLNSAYYHSRYSILQAAFERFGALYIHKLYYKHLTTPGLEPIISEVRTMVYSRWSRRQECIIIAKLLILTYKDDPRTEWIKIFIMAVFKWTEKSWLRHLWWFPNEKKTFSLHGLTLYPQKIIQSEFSPTWSCVSLTRSTTSSEWKLFRFDKMEVNSFQILPVDVTFYL